MTNYQLYRNRIQAAVFCAVGSLAAPIVLFLLYDPAKHEASYVACAVLLSFLLGLSAVLAYQLARLSWFDYYHGTLRGFTAFIRERREWIRNGYRKTIEVKHGYPPRTRPPTDRFEGRLPE